jgi:hypothetical protein
MLLMMIAMLVDLVWPQSVTHAAQVRPRRYTKQAAELKGATEKHELSCQQSGSCSQKAGEQKLPTSSAEMAASC